MIHPLTSRIRRRSPHSICSFPIALAVFAGFGLQYSAVADSLTYDFGGDSSNGINDGAGAWNTSAQVWFKDNLTADTVWPNTTDSIAIFGANTGAAGSAFTITVGTVTANGIVFNQANSSSGGTAQGYTLSGGSIALGGTAPSVTVNGPMVTVTSKLTATTFTKKGTGTLSINNTQNNLGAVTIEAGILDVFSTLTATDVVVAAGARFDTHSGTTWNINSLAYSGTGTSNLTSLSAGSSSTYTVGAGGLTINSGTVAVNAGTNTESNAKSTLILNGNLNMAGGTLSIQTSTTSTQAEAKAVLRGSLNVTGNATISNTGAGTQWLDLDGGVRTIDVGTNATTNLTLSSVIRNGGITKTGVGMVTLSGSAANTFTGMTTISGGTLVLNKTAGVDAIAGNITVATGGLLDWNAANQIADTANINLTGGTLKIDNFAETIGSLSQSLGTVNSSGSTNSGIFTILGALTVTGGQTINLNSGGQWKVGSASFSGLTTAISLNGNNNRLSLFTVDGDLTLTGQGISLSKGDADNALGSELALTGNVTASGTNAFNTGGTSTLGTSTVNLREGVRIWNITSGTTTVNSNVVSLTAGDGTVTPTRSSVVGGFEKTGNGTLTFNGVNTYTGNTTVSAGIFRLGASASINSTPLITVAPTATFDVSSVSGGFTLKNGQTLEGGGSISGAVTANNGSVIAAGTSDGDTTQTLTFNSGLKLSSGSALKLDIISAADFDKIVVTGTLTQENGAKLTIGPAVFTGALSIGQSFDFLDWTTSYVASTNLGDRFRDGSSDGAFDLDLPDISSSGYMWDIGNFATNGTVVVVVPEPGTSTLLAAAASLLGLRRRRARS